MAENDKLVDAEVIAGELGLGRTDVLKLARQRLIPSIRFSRKLIRFDRARVRAAVDQMEINSRSRR